VRKVALPYPEVRLFFQEVLVAYPDKNIRLLAAARSKERSEKGGSSSQGLCRSSFRCPGRRRHINKGGFDPFHEDLRLTQPRHALYPLLWMTLLYGRDEHDHRHLCLLRCALAQSAYEASRTPSSTLGVKSKRCAPSSSSSTTPVG
jgi:hypothetical protein